MKESKDPSHHIFEIHLSKEENTPMRRSVSNMRDSRADIMSFSADS